MISMAGRLAILIFAALNLGCVSTAPTTSETAPVFSRVIEVTSNPPYATCKFIGEPTIFKTPFSVGLPTGKNYMMRVEKEGFMPALIDVAQASETLAPAAPVGNEANPYRATADGPPMFGPHTIHVVLRPLPAPEPPPLVTAPPPPLVDEEKKPADDRSKDKAAKKALAKELDELNRLKRQGKITAKEYSVLRKKIIDRY